MDHMERMIVSAHLDVQGSKTRLKSRIGVKCPIDMACERLTLVQRLTPVSGGSVRRKCAEVFDSPYQVSPQLRRHRVGHCSCINFSSRYWQVFTPELFGEVMWNVEVIKTEQKLYLRLQHQHHITWVQKQQSCKRCCKHVVNIIIQSLASKMTSSYP